MSAKTKKEWDKYVKLVASMALSDQLGNGCTPEAFVMNLRLMADAMEKLLEPKKKSPSQVADQILKEFCETIEATGGLDSYGRPMGDRSWGDLGALYEDTCRYFGRAPMFEGDPE